MGYTSTRRPYIFVLTDTPLNNLIHRTSLPALTQKNATKLMATAASISNYIQSKNEQCVVITSIALTICSTHLYHLCALANTYWPLGIYASLVLWSFIQFCHFFLVISKLLTCIIQKFWRKKIQTKSKGQFREK